MFYCISNSFQFVLGVYFGQNIGWTQMNYRLAGTITPCRVSSYK